MLANAGLLVYDPDNEESLTIVLGYSHPFVLLPPAGNDVHMRTVPVDQVRFYGVRYDKPWSEIFQQRQPQGEEHAH